MKDDVLAIIVTRNNPLLLENFIKSLEDHSAGHPYHLIIADNSSTDLKQLALLAKLRDKGYNITTCPNDRVEGTFDSVSMQYIEDYKYFFFMHDDTWIHKDNWLKVFVDKANSHYHEPDIKTTHLIRYPIGRVANCHQPWRDYYKCKGFQLYSVFLKDALACYGEELLIFKYADNDRVLWTQDCLKKSGMWSIKKFRENKDSEIYGKICTAINNTLSYPDEGIPPRDIYPPGESWSKLTLLTEFMNSAWPLVHQFRTIGLQGDGYLEQLDGFDKPWGNDYIAHYGAPHTKRWLATKFNCSAEDIHKKIYSNDLTFLLKSNRMIKEYFK